MIYTFNLHGCRPKSNCTPALPSSDVLVINRAMEDREAVSSQEGLWAGRVGGQVAQDHWGAWRALRPCQNPVISKPWSWDFQRLKSS